MSEALGQRLRKTRLERGISIEQAAQALHIRPKYIEALEEDRRTDLPSPVQGKGFLRLYAGFLNLPVHELLSEWDGVAVTPVAPATTGGVIPASPAVEPPSNSPPISQPVHSSDPDSGAQAHFQSIGHKLHNQREVLGLTLAEVERYTHVRQHYIVALEEGRIDDLPSPVQGRGMLVNYAHFLSLDADGLLSEFAEGLQNRRLERLEKVQPTNKPRASENRSSKPATGQDGEPKPARKSSKAIQSSTDKRGLFRPSLLVSALIVFFIVILALWMVSQIDTFMPGTGSPTAPSIAEILLTNAPPTAGPTGTATNLPNLNTRVPGEGGSAGASQPTSPVVGTVPVSGTAPVQVYVVALQRAYLRITADGKVVFDGRVVPGNAYPFSAEKTIELLTGSAASIQVFYNQRDLGNLGVVGQVKSLLFSKEGAITPTSKFTVTPSRTPQPSATSRPSPTLPTSTITPLIP